MFGSSHVLQWRKGIFPSNASRWCRAKNYEGPAKDYEFSRQSMEEHWRAGYYDAVRTLRHPEVVGRPTNDEVVFTFDLAVDGRE